MKIMEKEEMEIRSYGDQAAPRVVESESGRTIEGYAIVFNQPSRVMYDRQRKRYFIEVVEPRAVTEEFLRTCDIKLNRNHDDDLLLARCRYGEGTLQLSVDDYGLKYRAEMPNTTAGNDTLESIRRGDLFGSSFRFTDARDGVRYEKTDMRGVVRRTIVKFGGIYDVSVVADPAYLGTSVNARSFGDLLEDEQENTAWKKDVEELRGAIDNY